MPRRGSTYTNESEPVSVAKCVLIAPAAVLTTRLLCVLEARVGQRPGNDGGRIWEGPWCGPDAAVFVLGVLTAADHRLAFAHFLSTAAPPPLHLGTGPPPTVAATHRRAARHSGQFLWTACRHGERLCLGPGQRHSREGHVVCRQTLEGQRGLCDPYVNVCVSVCSMLGPLKHAPRGRAPLPRIKSSTAALPPPLSPTWFLIFFVQRRHLTFHTPEWGAETGSGTWSLEAALIPGQQIMVWGLELCP